MNAHAAGHPRTGARSAILAGGLTAMLCAAPAAADWAPPQDLSGTTGRFALDAGFAFDGSRYISTFGPLPLFPGTPQVPVAISVAPASGFGNAQVLPDGLGAPLAFAPGGRVLAVGGPRTPLDYFGLERVSSALRARTGRFGTPLRAISTNGITATRTLATAINDRGDAAIVFSRCRSAMCSSRTVLATFSRRGQAFSAPVVLATRTGYPVASVALNAHGDALLAWSQHRAHGSGNDIRVRLRRASGALTQPRIVGPTQPVPSIAVTLTGARRATVAWFSAGVGEGSVSGPVRVSAAAVHANGSPERSRVLDDGKPAGDSGNAVQGARVAAVLGPDGVTTVAWTGYAGGHYLTRAQRLVSGATRQTLSPAGTDTQLMDLAGDSAGDAIAVWVPASGGHTAPEDRAVGAALRAGPSAAFGAPERPLVGRDVSGSAAAAIAPGGRALVVGGPAEQGGNGAGAPPVRYTDRVASAER
jgi:hypothetical protein